MVANTIRQQFLFLQPRTTTIRATTTPLRNNLCLVRVPIEHLAPARLGGHRPDTKMLTTTKALCSPLMNALFAKVHHPLPIDKRESQRLLKILTTSFRKNLDEEHGFWAQDAPSGSLSTSSLPNLRPTSTSTSAKAFGTSRDDHRRPTDRHVRAILSNPLFSHGPSKPVASGPAERDPMDVFDQAVAKGLMSPQRAAGILVAKHKAITQSASNAVNRSLAASGTALRVLQWLRSSGLERNLSFMTTKSFVDALIPLMVEEGLEEAAWIWLERWMRGDGRASPANQSGTYASHASHLLASLVRAKVSPAGTLDKGYASIIRASDMFRESEYFDAAAIHPWRALVVRSTVFAWQRTQPSEALFESFAAMSDPLSRRIWSINVDRAHLELYHPTHPDATLAVQCLQSSMMERLRDRIQAATTADKPPLFKSIARKVILMATDAAQHLARTGHEAQAEWVGNVVLDKFGGFIRTEMAQGDSFWLECDLVQMFQAKSNSLPS